MVHEILRNHGRNMSRVTNLKLYFHLLQAFADEISLTYSCATLSTTTDGASRDSCIMRQLRCQR